MMNDNMAFVKKSNLFDNPEQAGGLDSFGDIAYLVLVAFLWGFTNPMIKEGGEGIELIKKSNPISQFLYEVHFLISTWRYMVPFLMNQSGSIVYYVCLSTAKLSLAVPTVNSLTFIFTVISAKYLGEESISYRTLAGMCLVGIGTFLCIVGSNSKS